MPPGILLDLGATAKALTADWAARAVVQEFGGAALVSLRGDIATAGRSPQGGWQVAAHHILDPRTLMPAEPAWASVTAVAPTCVLANTLATASVVRGHGAPVVVLPPGGGTAGALRRADPPGGRMARLSEACPRLWPCRRPSASS